jgi:hypothetical protein
VPVVHAYADQAREHLAGAVPGVWSGEGGGASYGVSEPAGGGVGMPAMSSGVASASATSRD